MPASLAFALAALTALAPPQTPPDSVYTNAETARLVALARARHTQQDTLVSDYSATIRSQVRVGIGRSKFGRVVPFFTSEHLAKIHWSRPNDVRVDFVGRRHRSLTQTVRGEVDFDRPHFFPRGLGDSIRLMGDDFPEQAAVHPLATGGETYYRYRLDDSLTVNVAGRAVRLAAIEVQPRREAFSLIAGHLWIDRETGEIARLTFFFLGRFLFGLDDLDSTATRRDTLKLARENRVLSRAIRIDADLEYALYEQRYWMPFRQLVTLQVDDIWVTGATLPVRFETTFADYRINRGEPVVFAVELPDTSDRVEQRDTTNKRGARAAGGRWSGGRWEMRRPPLDSLDGYRGWTDSLELDATPDDEQRFKDLREELAAVAADLPSRWVGRTGITPVKFGEFFRFNRIQGVSLGSAYALETGAPYLSFIAQTRYGFKDGRVLWGLTARRDAPGGLLELDVSRRFADVDPRSTGTSLGNSLSGLLAGHDDAHYMLASGGGLKLTRPAGRLSEWSVRLGFEDHRSVSTKSGSVFTNWFGGDGILPPNPPVRDGQYGAAAVRVEHAGQQSRWRVGADGLVGEGLAAGRVWADVEQRLGLARIRLGLGDASRVDVPQLLMRVGGPRTVRGYPFGAQTGRAMWSAQAELMAPRSRGLVPFVFVDAGAAGDWDHVFRDTPLLAAGGGLSLHLLIADLRLEIARSFGPLRAGKARVDLLFRPTR